MTNDKPSNSAMHQRFQAISEQIAKRPEERGANWFEPELIEILMRPVPAGQAREQHVAKEHEIAELFERLTVLEAWTLHKRLTCKTPGDELVAAFDRLIIERRARLFAYLGDARRRAALARSA
ncbi:MAG: hypothetical protein H0T46_23400 [Deltaproteobacteria bacterium]|nr:hypothetical protein [Deltaproteobacteria bacterium]